MPEGSNFCPQCGKTILPAGNATGSAPIENAAPLAQNLAAVLAYFFIPAIAFLFWNTYKRNPFVRFHGFQAMLYCAAAVVFAIVIMTIGTIPAIAILSIPLGMVFFCGVIICDAALMIKAYQGERYKLPVLGELAERCAQW
jgi:uncharacterized membrane protein